MIQELKEEQAPSKELHLIAAKQTLTIDKARGSSNHYFDLFITYFVSLLGKKQHQQLCDAST
jgi:hypothetical protein